jgi:hypothetical protein
MKQRHLFALGLVVAVGVFITSVPASAARRGATSPKVPNVSVNWTPGTPLAFPMGGTRFDGEYVASLNRVFFLGFRQNDNSTDGSIWYYDVATDTYVDTGKDLRVPISNYQIAALTDAHGLGLYVFGGRDNAGAIVTTVQAYYPSANKAIIISSDPWPGTTPAGCVSLPAMGVAVVTNKAYLLGGESFSSSVPPCVDDNSAQTWIFDPMAPAGARWTAGPPLNLARGYITPAVLRGKIYTVGGNQNIGGTLFAVPTVESWKPPLGGWNDVGVADLPVPCDESQAFTPTAGPLRKGITLATCGQWPNALSDTYFYSALANTWALVGNTNEARRNEAGAIFTVGGQLKMYIAGGYDATGGLVLSSTEFGVGAPIGSRPGFSRPAPNTAPRPSTN